MPTVICPDCGLDADIEQLCRDASEFCTGCDYPLFWAPGAARALAGPDTGSGDGLRRLPGTAGRQELAALECPTCGEHQPLGTDVCSRCGGPMVLPEPDPEPEPQPVVELPPPPAPAPPPPPPPSRALWWWLALALALGLVTLAVILAI